MRKTTVYLPEDLKARLAAAAREANTSEAALIRAAVEQAIALTRPRPSGGLFRSTEPIADQADALLAGFGER